MNQISLTNIQSLNPLTNLVPHDGVVNPVFVFCLYKFCLICPSRTWTGQVPTFSNLSVNS